MPQELSRLVFVSVLFALAGAGAAPRTHAVNHSPGDVPAEEQAAPPESQLEPQGRLTLPMALERTAAHSPELQASAHGVRAAEQDARQAGVRPNPELEIEAEEFGGSGSRKGYDAAQTTARVVQSVELAGKRGKRRRMAMSEARLAGWEDEATRRDVLTQVRHAFVDVLLAQGQLALAESLLGVAEDLRTAAAARVQSGKVPPLEETKAGVEAAAARMARDRAKRDLDAARKRLAAFWGGAAAEFSEAIGSLEVAGDDPTLEELSLRLDEAPDVARWRDELARCNEALALARAERIPAVAVSVGISRFEDDGTRAASVGLSLPVPLFDRNAGGIASARHRLARAECEQQAARLRATTDLVEARNRLEAARAEALTMRAELIPGAQQAFDAAQAGYREGKFGYVEVLDVQRTLGEARTRYLDTLAAYHKAAADVERVSGVPLNTIR